MKKETAKQTREPREPKLVRDRIPEIIKVHGRKPVFRTANSAEYYEFLVKKLEEEVAEYGKERDPEELHDIMEVLYAIAEYHEISLAELERKRKRKAKERGQFKKRIILEDW